MGVRRRSGDSGLQSRSPPVTALVPERPLRVWRREGRLANLLLGPLPPLVRPEDPKPPRHSVLAPFTATVVHGMAVGSASGAVCATLLFPLAAPIGAAVGYVLSLVPSVAMGAAVTAIAVRWHTPLRDPHRFHRTVWLLLLVVVAVLDALVWLKIQGTEFQRYPALLIVPTVTVLAFSRSAVRRIVVTHAETCGWRTLDRTFI